MKHNYMSCRLKETGRCSGCRNGESTLDCMYDSLAICSTCGGCEGSLLPTCPGYWLSMDEQDANYQHYMNKTGPFAKLCQFCEKETDGFDEHGPLCIDCVVVKALKA
jgi:hypothetical protein